jgi:hypothetical protein
VRANGALPVSLAEQLVEAQVGDVATLTGVEHQAEPPANADQVAAVRDRLTSDVHGPQDTSKNFKL